MTQLVILSVLAVATSFALFTALPWLVRKRRELRDSSREPEQCHAFSRMPLHVTVNERGKPYQGQFGRVVGAKSYGDRFWVQVRLPGGDVWFYDTEVVEISRDNTSSGDARKDIVFP